MTPQPSRNIKLQSTMTQMSENRLHVLQNANVILISIVAIIKQIDIS